MKARYLFLGVSFILFYLLFGGCTVHSTDEPTVISKTKVIHIETKDIATVQTSLSSVLTELGLNSTIKSLAQTLVKSNVKVNKMVYMTKDNAGKELTVSGLILLPETEDDTQHEVVCFMHGTIAEQAKGVTTGYPNDYLLTSLYGIIAASFGKVVIVPDYIGYGESRLERHTYQHVILGKTVADMLLATKEYCNTNNIALHNDVYLTGYSEGGFASVATQKYIEENALNISIKKNLAGAGAIDTYAFTKAILEKKDQNIPFMNVYLWVFSTYVTMHNISYDMAKVFKEPYLTLFKGIDFDFSFALVPHIAKVDFSDIINKGVTPSAMFTEEFRAAILNDEVVVKSFTDAFKSNTIIDWKPIAPLVLLHGTADNFVYPFNSDNGYAKMLANGGNVSLKKITGKTHETAFVDYMIEVFKDLTGFGIYF